MILDWLERSVSRKVHANTYRGSRAALLPVDVALSYFAKRSYPAYRVWYSYQAATERWFGAAPASGDAYPMQWLDQLRDQGRTILRDSFPPAQVQAARAFVLDMYDRIVSEGRRRDPHDRDPRPTWSSDGMHFEIDRRTGRHRMYFDAAGPRTGWPELLVRFADHPAWHALAADYYGTQAIIDNTPYLMAEVMVPGPDIEHWHIDCVRPTLKAFLYLDDVSDAQGPLLYQPRSHHVDEQRHRLFYAILHGGLGNAYFDDAQNRRFDADAERCNAPAGTAILFDTQGFHSGSRCTQGKRIALVTGFRPATTKRVHPRMFRDPQQTPYPWERRPKEHP